MYELNVFFIFGGDKFVKVIVCDVVCDDCCVWVFFEYDFR